MANNKGTENPKFDESKARSWYDAWRGKVKAWCKRNGESNIASVLLWLPDLFMLCVGLIGDKRVPASVKISLVSAVAYVLSPFDLIPEAVLGVPGLIDDAGILAIALHAVLGMVNIDPDEWTKIMRDHWRGDEDPVKVIQKLFQFIMKNAARLFGKVWRSVIRLWIRKHKSSGATETLAQVQIT